MRAAGIVSEVAAAKGAKPGQIALAWILHKGEDIAPIPGTKRRRYLEENVAAGSIPLGEAEMEALDEALAPGKTKGPPYPKRMMATIDR
jgi:aryl-alcohol dehydrogenase-like predicted oxidoreductase